MADNKINMDLNFDDFDLPPLPARPVKLGEASKEPTAEDKSVDNVSDFELPPMPVKKAEPAEDKSADSVSDFELPPMPVKKAEPAEDKSADSVSDFELPPMPVKKAEPAEDKSADSVSDFELPPMPVKKAEPAEDKSTDSVSDFELPPMPEKKAEEPVQEEEPEKYEEEPQSEDNFDFDDDYDPEKIDTSNIVLEEMSHRVAPIRTGEEESARNMKEKIRMNDLALELGDGVPVLDDLSDEYLAPEKSADSLTEREHLDDDEKRILKQRLAEDLGKRPENFNARASQNMYNKLMEQKKLKIAKKGFAISLIPVLLGLVSAGIAFTKLGWGSYIFISYFSVFMVIAALMLLIKSKHTKLFAITIYALCLLLYVGPGLIMYVLDEKMQQAPDRVMHIVFVVAACACNIISIIILNKNEAVNTYYNSNFKRK